MKNNTKKQETKQETKLTSSREKLLTQLNDKDFACEFYKQKLDRAKASIGDILSVTSGCSIVVEDLSEYGHGCLIELLEIFSVSHENFSLIDFACDLQAYIFTWSMTYGDTWRSWQNARLAERGLDEDGVEIETAAELEAVTGTSTELK